MLELVLVCIIWVAISWYKNRGSNVIDDEEFQTALQSARTIKDFFVEAVRQNGFEGNVMVVKHNIDNIDEVDFSQQTYSSIIFFRICIEFGYDAYLEWLQNGVSYDGKPLEDDMREHFMNEYLKSKYGKNASEIKKLGIDPYNIVYNTKKIDNRYESVLYYGFCCPCELQGDRREIFVKELGVQFNRIIYM